MCFKVECKTCGKYSWGGCGKHLPSVYAGIEKGKHCQCRSWPGVPEATSSNNQAASAGATSAAS